MWLLLFLHFFFNDRSLHFPFHIPFPFYHSNQAIINYVICSCKSYF